MASEEDLYQKYQERRGIDCTVDGKVVVPPYLKEFFRRPGLAVLDIGCGGGQLIRALQEHGVEDVRGVDISREAVDLCRSRGLRVEKIEDIGDYAREHLREYDVIVMSHVLEHLRKERIIPTLERTRRMLKDQGVLLVMTPNAQSPAGCYWAYEDFTHNTIFTAGSLVFVLRAAGFKDIRLLDPGATAGLPWWKKAPKAFLLTAYRVNRMFWNKVTGSPFHAPSPVVFSFEVKVAAR